MIRNFTRRGWLVLAGATGILPAAAAGLPKIVLINESRSLPPGLYLRRFGVPPHRGGVVAFAQPEAARSYLAGLGAPPDMMLLKRVAAAGGDPVCRRDDRLHVAGAGAPVMGHDRLGGPLPQWRGCRVLEADELFLLGDTPGSFDSRYFGPVRLRDMKGVFARATIWRG